MSGQKQITKEAIGRELAEEESIIEEMGYCYAEMEEEDIGRDQSDQTLTAEQLKGNLILHTFKVWVSHDESEVLNAGTEQKTILDLVSRGEVTRHRLDGASVWVRRDEHHICIDEDPPSLYLDQLSDEEYDLRDEEMEKEIEGEEL